MSWIKLLCAMMFGVFVILPRPAEAAGECNGTAQPFIVRILSDGRYFLQETEVASYMELNQKLARIGFPDCIYVMIEDDTAWSVVNEILFPLGVVGDFRAGSVWSGGSSRRPVLLWVVRGYQGVVKL